MARKQQSKDPGTWVAKTVVKGNEFENPWYPDKEIPADVHDGQSTSEALDYFFTGH